MSNLVGCFAMTIKLLAIIIISLSLLNKRNHSGLKDQIMPTINLLISRVTLFCHTGFHTLPDGQQPAKEVTQR